MKNGMQEEFRILKNIDIPTATGIQDIKSYILAWGEGWQTSTMITCFSCERKDHTARFCPSRIPQRKGTESNDQGNTVTAAKPSVSRDFTVLTAKISVPMQDITNVKNL
ncbi:hypothetical protein NPIL_157591 [Nephila pilipes]|uniref:CCHC-type domain-containing protein n=1 Tax=Nephila pilipes TaxID=299642 RepID=A0A8X6K9I0_NEPPI|nr:hypothetical protein NPIL_157591 [Nephila pilipes]